MVGSEGFLFTCPTCHSTWMRRSGSELEPALPPPPGRSTFPEWLRSSLEPLYAITDVTLPNLEASSTDVVDRVKVVERSLGELLAKTTDLPQRKEIERIQDDARAAMDSARGARGATQHLQTEVRGLQKTFEELGLGTLSARVAELERFVDRHLKSHS